MQYMLAFKEPLDVVEKRDLPDHAPAYWGAWTAYVGALQTSGVVVGGNGLLSPHTGTTVRIRDGARQVVDGPYPDSKEQLGGYFINEVADLDAALEWAARSPAAAVGSVEVRPVLQPMQS